MSTTENSALPPLPTKRYFTLAEVSELCAVKPHVLRYWAQEFAQQFDSSAMPLRTHRRYYQHHEVQLIRRIRHLIYDQGFTISGVRNQLVGGAIEPDSATAVRLSAMQLQLIRDDLTKVKVMLDRALAHG